jgi:hypothetical protein
VTQQGSTEEIAIPKREPFLEYERKETLHHADGSRTVISHRLRRTLPSEQFNMVDTHARAAAELAAEPEHARAKAQAFAEGHSAPAALAIADARAAAVRRSIYEATFAQLFAKTFDGPEATGRFPDWVDVSWGDK